jgi:hypothetical protein
MINESYSDTECFVSGFVYTNIGGSNLRYLNLPRNLIFALKRSMREKPFINVSATKSFTMERWVITYFHKDDRIRF